jgi:hypothetical protein
MPETDERGRGVGPKRKTTAIDGRLPADVLRTLSREDGVAPQSTLDEGEFEPANSDTGGYDQGP